MVTIAKPVELIDANPDLADFVGGVPFEEVWVAESELGVTLPDSYREFLQKYGAGSFAGEPIFGLGVPDTGPSNVVWATKSMRAADDFFPLDLVVIQDTGQYDILCLATSRLNDDNECPVVQWIPEMSFEEQTFETINTTFAHFLLAVVRRGLG